MKSAKEARAEWEQQCAEYNNAHQPQPGDDHILLHDIRAHLKSIRGMLQFFVVLTIIGLVVEVLYVLAH